MTFQKRFLLIDFTGVQRKLMGASKLFETPYVEASFRGSKLKVQFVTFLKFCPQKNLHVLNIRYLFLKDDM